MARYLITGGAGFIGSAMALRLLKENHDVHIIDFEDCIEQARNKLHGAVFHCGDVFGSYTDTRKLLSLGWNPITDLDQGIELMLPSAIEALTCK